MRPIVPTMVLALVLVGSASAQPVMSLNASNLSALRVGDTTTIDVMLSGLAAGDMLELLAAEVGYDDQHFGTSTVTSGGIVPDVAGFTADEFVDLAGATFDTLDTTNTTDMITTNGTFFSFDFSATTIGSGQISLDFADALGEDSLNNDIDGATAGAALPYSIFLIGDNDLDGDIDGSDFLKWQRGESPNPLSASDLAEWEADFGTVASLSVTSATVPEPATGIILLIGMATMLSGGRTVVSILIR
jgi:hypothetical protein